MRVSERNQWKEISNELPSFSDLIPFVVGDGKGKHGRLALDRLTRKLPCLVGLFHCNLCWSAEEDLEFIFGVVAMLVWFRTTSSMCLTFKQLAIDLLVYDRGVSNPYALSRERSFIFYLLYGKQRCVLCCVIFEGKEIVEFVDGLRGCLLMLVPC